MFLNQSVKNFNQGFTPLEADCQRQSRALTGFTLIEVLVYLGLFAVVMAGIILSAYNMFELAGRTQTKAMVQAEGDFLLAKLNWALTGATNINPPASGGSGNVLTLTKAGTVITFSYDISDPNNKKLQITRGGGPVTTLNNVNISVETAGFIFTHTGSGVNPEHVRADFTLTTKTPTGATFSQNFSTTKYLQK